MGRRFALGSLLVSMIAIGCGTARPEPPATPSEPAPAAAPVAEADPAPRAAESERIPDACEQPAGNACTPPAKFAKRLCDGLYPDVALAMFAKGTPWTRAYVNHEVEAWNASGGGHATSAKLELGEEVLILVRREAKGPVQVGAGGNFDVLRWDGSCASLMSDEVTLKHPSKPKYAPIRWRSLDLKLRDALLTDPAIEKSEAERRKECSALANDEPPPKCAKADAQLGVLIVERVRSGGPLPLPDRLP